MSGYTIQEACYQHITLEGTPYEADRAQGEILKRTVHAQGVNFYKSGQTDPAAFGYRDWAAFRHALDRWCLGLNDEIQGLADSLGAPTENILIYMAASVDTCGCTHAAVLPNITEDGHVYVARSYELAPDDEDRRLCTTRIRGKAAHVGFSTLLVGRLDGLNEHGPAVTMSAAASPPERDRSQGFDFWVGMRAVLDQCQDTPEAVALLTEMPLNTYTNYLVVDRAGRGAVVEQAGTKRAVREFESVDGAPAYAVVGNGYTVPDFVPLNQHREAVVNSSISRVKAVERTILDSAPRVGREALQGILAKEYPEGCCCPYYQHGVGTLWSMLIDVTAGGMEVAFGAPTHDPWRTFTLDGPPGMQEFVARLPTKV
jgi:hypothetical protein